MVKLLESESNLTLARTVFKDRYVASRCARSRTRPGPKSRFVGTRVQPDLLGLAGGLSDSVLQRNDSGLVNLVSSQIQLCYAGGRWEQRNPTAQKYLDDGDLNCVDKRRVKQAAKEGTTSEQPNVFA